MRMPTNTDAVYMSSAFDENPVDLFDRKEYAQCLHSVMYCLALVNDPSLSHKAILDDGLAHELVHLITKNDICTHHSMNDLRSQVDMLFQAALQILEDEADEG